MIVLDEQAKPCFKSVMQRFQARKEKTIKHLTKSNPAHFVAFDFYIGVEVANVDFGAICPTNVKMT
jgi:hypothetical protein